MGAACSSENQIYQEKLLDVNKNAHTNVYEPFASERANWEFEIASCIENHCELGEDYFMPFMEYVSAFWTYTQSFKYKEIGYVNNTAFTVLKAHKPEIKVSGFGFGEKSNHNKNAYEYTYLIGMRLKTFPLKTTKP